jgi:hypothetical protein
MDTRLLPMDWVAGGLTAIKDVVLLESGDWTPYLPVFEAQKRNGKETMGCSGFAELNLIETLFKFHGQEKNFSDRYVVVGSGTDPLVGNSMKAPADFINNNGLIYEEEYKWVDGAVEYFRPIESEMFESGKKWLENYAWNYQRLNFTAGNYIEGVQKYLKRGPIKVCGRYAAGSGILKPGNDFNHFMIIYKIDDTAQYIFDSYDGGLKRYSLDYMFILQQGYLTIKEKHAMEIKDNKLYLLVEGGSQILSMGVDDKLMVFPNETLCMMNAYSRSADHIVKGDNSWLVPQPITLSDWNSANKINSKNEVYHIA